MNNRYAPTLHHMRSAGVVFLLVVLSTQAFAQLRKGSIGLGADFNIAFTSIEFDQLQDQETTARSILLSPQFEYVVNEKLSLSLMIGFGIGSVDTDVNRPLDINNQIRSRVESDLRGFNLGGAATNYTSVGDRFYVSFRHELSYEQNVLETRTGVATPTSSGETLSERTDRIISIGSRPGLLYFVTPKLALRAQFGFVGWQGTRTEWETTLGPPTGVSDSKSNRFGFDFSSESLLLGIRFYL